MACEQACRAQGGEHPLRIANLGIQPFYDALVAQGADCVQMEWSPPPKQDAEVETLLSDYL